MAAESLTPEEAYYQQSPETLVGEPVVIRSDDFSIRLEKWEKPEPHYGCVKVVGPVKSLRVEAVVDAETDLKKVIIDPADVRVEYDPAKHPGPSSTYFEREFIDQPEVEVILLPESAARLGFRGS